MDNDPVNKCLQYLIRDLLRICGFFDFDSPLNSEVVESTTEQMRARTSGGSFSPMVGAKYHTRAPEPAASAT